jgi:DNA-binding SARP family transcriptional activator
MIRVRRRSGGYVLDLDHGFVDVHRFRALVDASRRSAGEASRLLREALELWRGDALGGLEGRWADQVRQAYRQQYLDAVVAWAWAELRGGDPATVVDLLTRLTEEHPYAEPVAAMLLRALHPTGRTAAALARFTTVRARLVEELGKAKLTVSSSVT